MYDSFAAIAPSSAAPCHGGQQLQSEEGGGGEEEGEVWGEIDIGSIEK